MAQLFSNNATATLASNITNVATSIVLATGKGALFNAPTGGDYELLTLTDGTNVEIVKVTARSSDTLTVTRGQEGTTGRAWASSNTTVYAGITKGTLGAFAQNFATGTTAIALGPTATATATASTSLGNSADATGTQGTALGDNSAAGAYATGVGSNANASGQGSVAAGYGSAASGADSIALRGTANASKAVAIGNASKGSDDNSVAIGSSALTGFPTTWLANTAYTLRQVVKGVTNDNAFICVTAGTSGSSEPSWDVSGGQTTDGTATWQDLSAESMPEADTALGTSALAFSDSVALGRESRGVVRAVAAGRYSVAAGYSVAIGGNATAYAQDSVAIGYNATCSYPAGNAYCNVALGDSASALGALYCMALGSAAENRIDNSWTTAGAPLIRKDNGEDATKEHLNYAGAEAVFFSKEIDLKTLADDCATITITTGATFYPNEIGLIITASSSVTGNPNVSFGVTGNTTALQASTTVTAVAAKNRTVYTPASKNGVNSLTASVKTAATGTTLKGRFYWVGLLVEDE